MAKQTFTTGQVLTAAQMTSLQQTAMGGGSTTAKTASYVLVAADAGTVVQMNSASATTITVNTALFAAGDTVQIQNVGAGVCTVTAGTATVSTSAVLSLKQYDAGTLYFNTTSAAIFFATDAADSTSPLTTKGDLYAFSTTNDRLPVGTNNQILVADSTASTGLKWATASSGALTLITTNTFSAQSSVSINNVFSSTYDNYRLLFTFDSASVNATYNSIRLRASGSDTSTNYKTFRNFGYTGTVASGDLDPVGTDEWFISDNGTSFNGAGVVDMTMYSPNRAKYSVATTHSAYNWGSYTNATIAEWQTDATQFDGFTLLVSSGTITGNVSIYGYGK